MSEAAPPPGAPEGPRPALPGDFRWRALFQKTSDPLFLLDRRRRLVFVNTAWEALTGRSLEDLGPLVCRRPRPAAPSDGPDEVLAHALTPPPEVIAGQAGRVRRLLPAQGEQPRRWWDVEFFPLQQGGVQGGQFILGRVAPLAAEQMPQAALPEKVVALRERVASRHRAETWASALPAVRRLLEQVRLASQVAVPVLLVGEAGTGKATLARTIHYLGPGREGSFAALDCTRLPPRAVAAVLFGVSGAGTLTTVYLKEPAHLPRDVQLRLCAQLQSAQEVRILAGSARPPAEDVRAGRLLEELHCALATLVLEVPPLRERTADLPALVDALLERANSDGGEPATGLTAEAWELVRGSAWPGNLRELYAVLAAARRHAGGGLIGAADLPAYLRLSRRLEETPGPTPERALPLDVLLEQAERRLIELALRRTKGHKGRAAEVLSIWRQRLVRRMEALGIEDPEG
jgi:DNA-binding NtrC family response regulator